MFDSLSDRLDSVFKKIKGHGRLDEKTIQEGLREVRLALLEADVNYKVVKDFIDRVKERSLGQDVLSSLTPGQQVIKIVHEELVQLLGGEHEALQIKGRGPAILMLVGLQGSGKTTTAAKLALHLRQENRKPYLVPADVYRPAAIDQLHKLASQLDVPAYPSRSDMDPVQICSQAITAGAEQGADVLIFDTAGRLHVDEALMQELAAIKAKTAPSEILFVADSMTGQDAVNVAQKFNDLLDISGVVLTKLEGDARGGAALSIRSITGKPIKFIGTGEKLKDLEAFHPDRVASRILGMGDMLTLIEKAQQEFDDQESEQLEKKFRKAEFDLEDFRSQMRKIRKLGSVQGLMKMIPGLGKVKDQLQDAQLPEDEMTRMEALINSMTPDERHDPKIINAGRKARIARGSGTEIQDVNKLLKNFSQMQKMLKKFSSKGKKGKSFPGMPDMANLPGMSGHPGLEAPANPGSSGGVSGGRAKKDRKKKKKKFAQGKKKKR
ncbi:MAG: signal recognition particle protein [Desulfohalobiaceae bacterium]|nr:signal recognition particle protein [Desulfohalobiaceae bacterium]